MAIKAKWQLAAAVETVEVETSAAAVTVETAEVETASAGATVETDDFEAAAVAATVQTAEMETAAAAATVETAEVETASVVATVETTEVRQQRRYSNSGNSGGGNSSWEHWRKQSRCKQKGKLSRWKQQRKPQNR